MSAFVCLSLSRSPELFDQVAAGVMGTGSNNRLDAGSKARNTQDQKNHWGWLNITDQRKLAEMHHKLNRAGMKV